MKPILYAGATLMIGASIYGFVDYQKTSHKKEFTTMYKEPEAKVEPVKEISSGTVTAKDEKTETVPEKKPVVKKEKITEEEVMPVIQPIADEEKRNMTGTKSIGKTEVTLTPSKESPAVVKKKKRTFSTKLFSRGALDERYIKEEVSLEPVKKKESVKSENKEQ